MSGHTQTKVVVSNARFTWWIYTYKKAKKTSPDASIPVILMIKELII